MCNCFVFAHNFAAEKKIKFKENVRTVLLLSTFHSSVRDVFLHVAHFVNVANLTWHLILF